MSNPVDIHIRQVSNEIREILSNRQRQVETGCVIKVHLANMIDANNISDGDSYMYGIVGKKRYYCESTDSRAYDVTFSLDGITISRSLFPMFTVPVFENDMVVLRYPEQNASIDDPNIDDFFFKKSMGNGYQEHLILLNYKFE